MIGADGEQQGVVSTREAIELAEQAGMDLVEVSPNAEPPVCRIMDFGKYIFEQRKKAAVAKKKQKQTQVKEIKFRPTTEKADYEVKVRKIRSFLEDGDKVKVTVRFRGREMMHADLGSELMTRVAEDIADIGQVEMSAKREGRQMIMVLAPARKK